MKNLTFITGAVRSGKSLLAEDFASKSGRHVFYLASMQILEEDEEQLHRLDLHRARRPTNWVTVDAAFDAQKTIANLPAYESFVIFDCLSLYVTNILITTDGGVSDAYTNANADANSHSDANSEADTNSDPYLKEAEVMAAVESLLAAMSARAEIEFVIVSNEVGWGVVPETKLGRAFRDFLGIANQMAAAQADKVFLSCSGLRLQLK